MAAMAKNRTWRLNAVFGYYSKTKAFRANLTRGKIVIQVKIYLLLIFQMNQITGCWVAAPELVILRKFCPFSVII